MVLFRKNFLSAAGNLVIETNDQELISVFFQEPAEETSSNAVINTTIEQLNEYFAGKRKSFELPLYMEGTEFQKKVWTSLEKIPYGETISYLQLAEKVSTAEAVRAVGHANGTNKLLIILPCHRVVGSNGALTGYAGGLDKKRWLLDFEMKNEGKILF